VVLQVQGVQQATPVVLQPAQQQQVYTLPSGEQLLLGGTTAGAMQQHTLAGNISNTAIGAAGRSLVLPQPLQDGQTSCYSTGKGQVCVSAGQNQSRNSGGDSLPYLRHAALPAALCISSIA
jgi:hypothetical protein